MVETHRPRRKARADPANWPPEGTSLAGRAFLAGVALALAVLAMLAAHWRPLWFDELFTFYVAQEPSLAATLRVLLDGADTNPPFDYLIRHVSLELFGTSTAAFRAPSAAAFVVGLFAIYAYVRRRAPFLASTAAFLLPISTAAVWFSYEGRAYALLFASGPIALVAWQKAVDRPRHPLSSLSLVAALCLGPFSHYLGVLNFAPVVAGELWRCAKRRAVDWGIAGSVAAAAVLLPALLPFARNATTMKGTFWASGYSLGAAFGYYEAFLDYMGVTAVVVLGAAVVLAPLACWRTGTSACRAMPAHEVVAAVVLALTPFSAYLLAELVTGALTSKYAITLVAGVAILGGYLLAYVETPARIAVLVSVLGLAGFGIGNLASAAFSHRGEEPLATEILDVLRASPLPVAFDSPHQFLVYVHYEPQLARQRFFYPMDADTALAMRGFNNDELALRRLGRIAPMNVSDYADFTSRNPEFLVMYSTQFVSALAKALQGDGYCLRTVAQSGPTTLLHATRDCGRAQAITRLGT